MFKCAYCGNEYDEKPRECLGCGARRFVDEFPFDVSVKFSQMVGDSRGTPVYEMGKADPIAYIRENGSVEPVEYLGEDGNWKVMGMNMREYLERSTGVILSDI